ncbi:MAG: hypothetical protein M1834_006408 [Cirrosporium novae-zelandiae]|nr:MAG: hypothetical protein M1834_006408 [Cirrosporium novae-zelandiae]
MGRQAYLNRLALGRSPFAPPDVVLEPVDELREIDHDTYEQQYNSRGRPVNPTSRAASRRLRRAENEILSNIGVLVNAYQTKATQPAELSQDALEKIESENRQGYFIHIVDITLLSALFSWVKAIKARLQTFKTYTGINLGDIIQTERDYYGFLQFFLPGIPASIISLLIQAGVETAFRQVDAWLRKKYPEPSRLMQFVLNYHGYFPDNADLATYQGAKDLGVEDDVIPYLDPESSFETASIRQELIHNFHSLRRWCKDWFRRLQPQRVRYSTNRTIRNSGFGIPEGLRNSDYERSRSELLAILNNIGNTPGFDSDTLAEVDGEGGGESSHLDLRQQQSNNNRQSQGQASIDHTQQLSTETHPPQHNETQSQQDPSLPNLIDDPFIDNTNNPAQNLPTRLSTSPPTVTDSSLLSHLQTSQPSTPPPPPRSSTTPSSSVPSTPVSPPTRSVRVSTNADVMTLEVEVPRSSPPQSPTQRQPPQARGPERQGQDTNRLAGMLTAAAQTNGQARPGEREYTIPELLDNIPNMTVEERVARINHQLGWTTGEPPQPSARPTAAHSHRPSLHRRGAKHHLTVLTCAPSTLLASRLSNIVFSILSTPFTSIFYRVLASSYISSRIPSPGREPWFNTTTPLYISTTSPATVYEPTNFGSGWAYLSRLAVCDVILAGIGWMSWEIMVDVVVKLGIWRYGWGRF